MIAALPQMMSVANMDGGMPRAVSFGVDTSTKLIFHTQPDGGVSGTNFTQQPVIYAVDGSNVLATGFTGNVTLDFYNPSPLGTLSGTVTVAAVGGIATFTNVKITGAGGAVLKATASGKTDGRSGRMTVISATPSLTKTVLTFGALTTDQGSCGSNAALDDLTAADMTTVVRMKHASNSANQFALAKWTGWYAPQLDASGRIACSTKYGTTDAFYLSSTTVTAGSYADIVCRWNISTKSWQIFYALVGVTLSEVSYTTTTTGVGTRTSDAAANLLIGNLTGSNPVKADMEWVAIFTKALTPAQHECVRIGMDRNDATMIRNATGTASDCWLLHKLNATGTLTDLSGQTASTRDCTITGATTATGETVYVPQVWANSYDPVDQTTWKLIASMAELQYSTTATSVLIGMYKQVNLASTYDPQSGIVVNEGTTYKGFIQATNGPAHSYGSLALTAGSKVVHLVSASGNRNGSVTAGVQGVCGVALSVRFNASATEQVPPTPTSHTVFFTDSLGDGYVTNPMGTHAPLHTLRQYMAGLTGAPQLTQLGYGGNEVYLNFRDSTTRTAFVTLLKQLNPTVLCFVAPINDYVNNVSLGWSTSTYQTAWSDTLDAIHTEFPDLVMHVVTQPTVVSGEGAVNGVTCAQFRTSIVSAYTGRAYVTGHDGPAEYWDGTNSTDTIHYNNTGGDTILPKLKTILAV